jgi:hypothetical protein
MDAFDHRAALTQLINGGNAALNRSIQPVRQHEVYIMSENQLTTSLGPSVTPELGRVSRRQIPNQRSDLEPARRTSNSKSKSRTGLEIRQIGIGNKCYYFPDPSIFDVLMNSVKDRRLKPPPAKIRMSV